MFGPAIMAAAGGWLSTNNDAIFDGLNYNSYFIRSESGAVITPDTVLDIPEWLSLVSNIGDDFGKLPTFVYDEDRGGNRTRARGTPLYSLLHDMPNPNISAMNFKQLVVNWAYNWEAFRAEIEFKNGSPLALWPIHPGRIKLKTDKGTVYYEINSSDVGVAPVRREAWQIFDFHRFGPDGFRGYILPKQGRNLFGLGQTLMQYAAKFFKDDTTPSVALIHEEELKYEQQAELRQWWINQHEGPHGVAVLSGKLKLERFDIDPEKAQLLQSRQFTARQFCMLGRFPVAMLGLFDNNYSNVEAMREGYYPETIHPLCVLFDQECKRKLLDDDQRESVLIETDMNAMLRGSPTTRANVQRTRIYSGTMTPNEAKRMENENTAGPEGDVLLVPTNMAPLSMVVEGRSLGSAKGGNPAAGESPNPVEEPGPDTSQMKQAAIFRPLFFAAAERCVEKQAKATWHRASAKADDWRAWCPVFFAKQGNYWRAAMGTVADAYSAALGQPPSLNYETVCRETAEASARDADAAFAGGPESVLALCESWRDTLAEKVTDTIMQAIEEEYGHAR